MELNDFINLVKNRKQTILAIVLLFLLITAILTGIQPLKYGSTSKVLVIQNFDLNVDPYAISKSNEYLSNILANVTTSNSFYNNIFTSGYYIDKNYFSKNNNIKDEMKKWRKTVQAKAIGDTGIIEINVYHPNKEQLNQIALAVNYVLQTKHEQYHGMGNNVIIKIIDKPIISNWPVKPNIPLNLALAIIVGLIISFSYIYLFPEEKFRLKLWPNQNRKKINKQEEILYTQPANLNNQWEDSGSFRKNTKEESGNYIPVDDLDNGYNKEGYKEISIQGNMNNIFRNPNRDDF